MVEKWTSLFFSWSGRSFSLNIADSDRILDLKVALFSMTDVPPERQKILGLVKGKLPPDDERIGDLGLINGKKFTLVGTPRGHELKDPSQLELLSDVVNDLDVDFSSNPSAAESHKNDQRNIRKIREATANLKINLIHPLREGKRLLVLDIDYTILDTKPLTSGALPPSECARPRLHEFLTAVYPYYDICIWSQTSWIWLETKLIELGMLGGSQSYQVRSGSMTSTTSLFTVLDKTPMFTVFSKRDGKSYSHHVKPLQIIWNHFPQYNGKNTIHVDDLGRNFALNPRQGLKISAFKDAHTPRAMADRELDDLAKYLLHVATIDDMETLNHKDWKRIVRALPPH
ncbi:HAD-like domain-containing protein [Lactifluus volemus]|nr:HAD-like domain-containing protein [Lactifluus volemus]